MSFGELFSLGLSGSGGVVIGEGNRPKYTKKRAVACEADNNIGRLGI